MHKKLSLIFALSLSIADLTIADNNEIIKQDIDKEILIKSNDLENANHNNHEDDFFDEDDFDYEEFDSTESNHIIPVDDPFEQFNRAIFFFNGVLDFLILEPIAIFYDQTTNNYIKQRISLATNNLSLPVTATSYLLQKKPQGFFKSFWGFIVNSTLGFGGMFDVAGEFGLGTTKQTIGDMFASYGAKPGPYLVLPFLGSVNGRGLLDIPFASYINPVQIFSNNIERGVTIVDIINKRQQILPITNYIKKHSLDPYISVRNGFHQNREASVNYPKK